MTVLQNKRFSVLKKTAAAVLLVSFIVPPLLVLRPEKVHAQNVPVQEVPLKPTHIQHLKETFLNVTGKEYGLDGVLWLVAKQLIQQLTSDLVAWINSGFNGSPAFVQDFKGFMLGVADRALGEYLTLSGSPLAFLCSPFQLNISLSIQRSFFPPEQQSACTLTGILGNINSFLSGTFAEGGFANLIAVNMVPQNNMYGAYLMQQEFLSLKIASGQKTYEKQMDWGRGFLSFEKCAQPEPGLDEVCSTQTPGAVIESQLEHVLGSGVRQLEIADEFDEVIAALIGQLINLVLTEGLANLGGGGGSPPLALTTIGKLNPNLNFPNQQVGVPQSLSDSFVPPPDGTLPTGSYTISAPGTVYVAPGGTVTIPVTKTGTASAASLSVTRTPSVVTSASFDNNQCTPTCTSNVIFTINTNAAIGLYTATISGSPSPSNGPINVAIDVTNTPQDTTPPTISVSAVIGLTGKSGPRVGTITAIASDDRGVVSRVEFLSGNLLIATDTSAPYEFIWDSNMGLITMEARAFDPANNSASAFITP